MSDTSFGCVTLLDALGTRTASIENAQSYLRALADIRTLVSRFQIPEDPAVLAGTAHPGGDFRIRFFGDSILITLPFEREHLNWAPIARMFSGSAAIVSAGINRGILFRGALSIGRYIESEEAVLGPAIVDAASWYELPDMFGVIATPNAMFSIQRVLVGSDPALPSATSNGEALGVPYSVPLKVGRTIATHVADWVFSARIQSRDAMDNVESWFLARLEDALVSPDVESKYAHSLAYLRYCSSRSTRTAP